MKLAYHSLSPCARVRIETPRGSFAKRRGDGGIEFVTPVPCPFNYGCVPDVPGADGPLDAIVLGPRLPAGTEALFPVRAIARFIDGGVDDDKLVCGPQLTDADRRAIELFFAVYVPFKRLLGLARGRTGRTAFLGWDSPGPC